MHLAYVTAALPFGFSETFIVPEVVELRERGHRVTVIPIRPRGPVVHEDARQLADDAISAPLVSLWILASALAELMRTPTRVVRAALLLAMSRNPRIFFKNLAVFPKGLWLARVSRRRGIEHIHAHWASTSATAAMVASLVSGIPWSLTAHRWDICEDNLLRLKAESAAFVRAIGARAAHQLADLLGSNQKKLRLIHVGVTLQPQIYQRAARSEAPLRVVLAANFLTVKGHRYAIEAVALLKQSGLDVTLDCAGEGPLRKRIARRAADLDVLDRVRFPGLVDHRWLLNELRHLRWDVALLPSVETDKDWEGIPVFLMEAMAAGVPVVATGTGGIPELLVDGAGLVIRERSATAIADALASLAHDNSLRDRLVAAGLRRVRDQFAVESSVSAILDEIAAAGSLSETASRLPSASEASVAFRG